MEFDQPMYDNDSDAGDYIFALDCPGTPVPNTHRHTYSEVFDQTAIQLLDGAEYTRGGVMVAL